jgi:hypothetical protein
MALGLAAFTAFSSILGACGGASLPGRPSSLQDAEHEIDANEARLSSVLGGPAPGDMMRGSAQPTPGQPTTSAQPTTPAQPGAPPPTVMQDKPASRPNAPGQAAQEESGPRDRCEVACEALTSMLRAVDRLCDLTGQGDERCINARERVNRATARVTEVCPSCSV